MGRTFWPPKVLQLPGGWTMMMWGSSLLKVEEHCEIDRSNFGSVHPQVWIEELTWTASSYTSQAKCFNVIKPYPTR
uniref:Uncharacterized protein n=1 Tax=Anguilla anguilla TaxID=7936 RepID=A0A0E9XPD5_ANGAN